MEQHYGGLMMPCDQTAKYNHISEIMVIKVVPNFVCAVLGSSMLKCVNMMIYIVFLRLRLYIKVIWE